MFGPSGAATPLPAPTAELLIGLLTKREMVEINLEELMVYLKRMRLEVAALLSCLRDTELSLEGIPHGANAAKFDINNATALVEMCPAFEVQITHHDRSQRCKASDTVLYCTTLHHTTPCYDVITHHDRSQRCKASMLYLEIREREREREDIDHCWWLKYLPLMLHHTAPYCTII